jgi:hypothetical protein
LLIGALVRDEKLAMRALEPFVAVGAARQQLGLEGLPAMRANDFVGGLLLRTPGHTARIAR